MSEESAKVGHAAPEGLPVCPRCFEVISTLTQICPHCSAVVGDTVNLDPLGNIYGRGFLFSMGAYHPRSLITLIGMWLVFGIWLFLPLSGVGVGLWPWSTLPFTLLIALIAGVILWRTTRNYIRNKRAGDFSNEEADG
jgi:hypothetical protein